MTVGKQLMLVFGTLVVLVFALSYTSLSAIGSLETRYNETANRTYRKAILADAINSAESDMLGGQRGMLMYAILNNTAAADSGRQLFHSSAERIVRSIQEARTLTPSADARQTLDRIESSMKNWLDIFAEMEKLCQSNHGDQAVQMGRERALPIYEEIGKLSAHLTQIQTDTLESDRAQAGEVATRSRWIAMILVLLSVASGVVAFWVVRNVSTKLKLMAHELGEGAEQLASAAAQVASASQSLAQGASEQAASLEETSASSEEINSMTMKNSENSGLAAQNMVDAARKIDTANESLTHMIASMNEINASSDKISRIIKVIDEIAFQTNILALNAAVEAARAGDAGAGFAVVADEVRSLAQRCAQAARDTSELIAESIEKSNEGKNRLAQVASAIEVITESATHAKTLVEEVNQASREQTQGMAEVSRAITQMQQVTQNSAASAEEAASAGEELSAQSGKLRTMVQGLTEMVGV